MPLERYLADLADQSKPFKGAGLVLLSALTPAEMEVVRAYWGKIPPERRRQVLLHLLEMETNSVELDFTPFLQFCLQDPDEEVRAQAVEGLWESEERPLITTLLVLLRSDQSPRVRSAAAQALGRFVHLVQEGVLPEREGERIRRALLDAYHRVDQGIEVKRRALESLAPFCDAKIDALIQEAYRSREPLLRQGAIYAMGRTCDARWLPTVLQELDSPDPVMRREAASACGELGDEAALSPLLARWRTEDDLQVRLTVISALGAIGGPVAKKFLQGLLKTPEAPVREAARQALENLEFTEDPLSFKYS